MRLSNLFLLIFGIFSAVIFIEVFFHIFPQLLPSEVQVGIRYPYLPPTMGDAYLGYKLKPNISATYLSLDLEPYNVSTLSLGFEGIGFRDDGLDAPRPFAVVLGDSFPFGVGVDINETWVEQLEKTLGEDVANMGVASYSSTQQTRMLAAYGTKLRPKVVLYTLTTSYFYPVKADGFERWVNSGSRDLNEWMESEKAKADLRRRYLKRVEEVLNKHSIIYKIVWTGRWRSLWNTASDGTYVFKDNNINMVFHYKYWYDLFQQNERNARGEELTKRDILEAKRITDESGATLIVIIFPIKEHAYWHILKNFNGTNESYFEDPADNIGEFCRETGLYCLDMTSVFKEHAIKGEQLYFRIDGHFNKNGNELVAKTVAEYLEKNNLLKGS